MAKQSQKSEQITQSLDLVYDYDQTMRKTIDFETAFREALGNIEVEKYENHSIYKYKHNNVDTYFLTGAITWLNKPHPLFKKRLQLKDWYRDFYDKFIHKENTDVRIVGVYRYDGMHIFVEFSAEEYMENKLNSSSAHVYTNDLYQALKTEYFRKKDQNGNTITTIASKNFKKYIDEVVSPNQSYLENNATATPKQFYVERNEVKTVFDEDNKLKKDEMKEILENLLGNRFVNIDYYKGQKILTGYYETEKSGKIFLMMANITFMGGKEGQHPIDLKRIQYNVRWRNFYEEYKEKGKVIWMGIYSYKDVNIFGVFEPETYLKGHEGDGMTTKSGKISSYSCHIFLNDLLLGYENGIFDKRDQNNNHIWAISSNSLKDYFEGNKEESPITSLIKKINTEKIDWNRWIRADEAIHYIKGLESKTGLNKWAQNMWSGWYLEGIYSEYLYNHPSEYIEYLETSKNGELKKEYENYGLDLAFPNEKYKFIGDLKNVCDNGGDAYLNDETNTKAALKKYNKIWFVIYIHEKKPGETNDYEMVKWYNHFKYDNGRWNSGEFNELSAKNTPHSIKMTEMIIVELNEVTEERYFTIKSQGKNSNGKPRPDKYAINKKLLKKLSNEEDCEEKYFEKLFEVFKEDDGLVIYRENHKK